MSEKLNSQNNSSDDGMWSILKEHGGGFGKPIRSDQLPGPYRHVSLREAVANDHGVGPGVPIRSDQLPGPYRHVSLREAVANDHGVGLGVPGDPMERYGTRDENLLATVNKLSRANWVDGDTLKKDIESLPDKSLEHLISLRFKHSANALDDRGSDKERIGKEMYLDLSIIAAVIDSGREITNIDTAQYLGEEKPSDLSGVLDSYAEKIKESGNNIVLINAGEQQTETSQPLNALEVVDKLKESLKTSKQD